MTLNLASPSRKTRSANVMGAFALVLALLFTTAAPASAATLDSSLEKSILLIGMTWTGYVEYPNSDGGYTWTDPVIEAHTTCTGWFASTTGDIVTAGHCVDPAEGKKAILQEFLQSIDRMDLLAEAEANWTVEGQSAKSPIERVVRVVQPPAVEGAVITSAVIAQVVAFQAFDEGDVTLLNAAGINDSVPLSIALNNPEVGSSLTAIGFPGAILDTSDTSRVRASFKSGTASSQQIGTNGIAGTEVNADISPGMSGGPTIDLNGNVLGVNSYLLNNTTQNFNFITDTAGLRKFLAKNDVKFVTEKNSSGGGLGGFTALVMFFFVIFVFLVVIAIVVFLIVRSSRRKSNNRPPAALIYGQPTASTQPPFNHAPVAPTAAPFYQAPVDPTPPSIAQDAVAEPEVIQPDPEQGRISPHVGEVTNGMVFCTACGTGHTQGASFCSKCGHPLI
ncbi:trypsin-like peptidase domain-containing protein [Candidatus Saccharibacteria bacterium]|nr:trypsin-like peptidase domain-containing protein [Candidatus Saccharibacteria bacterium]